MIEQFIEEGFVRIDNAFSPTIAEQARDILWKDLPVDRNDPKTWTEPVIRLGMYSQQPFIDASNTPALYDAFDQLVGANRWIPCKSMGTFPVRFPVPGDPNDTGWHIDVSFANEGATSFFDWRANWRSKGRALLMLFLFSDIDEQDAPTRIKVGSHRDIAKVLKPAGEEGLSLREIADLLPTLPERTETLATGKAGTVYLCHPFLVHAGQPNYGRQPRFLAQPPLLPREAFLKEGNEDHYSPVELAMK